MQTMKKKLFSLSSLIFLFFYIFVCPPTFGQEDSATVVRVLKYNTKEILNPRGKTVFAYIDFLQTKSKHTWDIIVNRSECKRRDISKCKNTREIYRYSKDGKFHLVKTESVTFKK